MPVFIPPPVAVPAETESETRLRTPVDLMLDLQAIAAIEGRSLNSLLVFFLALCRDSYMKEKGLKDLRAAAAKIPPSKKGRSALRGPRKQRG